MIEKEGLLEKCAIEFIAEERNEFRVFENITEYLFGL